MLESHAWGLQTSFSLIKDNIYFLHVCLTHTSRRFCSCSWSIKKFNSISLKYSKKACNVDCVSEVYQNTLKLLLSDCILIVGTRHELHIGAVEMLKGSWNIFEKILSSGQMYLENCQKFLGCFGNLAVIQKSLTLVSEKIGRYIPAHGQRRMGGHPVLGRHWKQCIPHFTLHLLFSVTSNRALSRPLVSWTVLCNQG